MSVTVRALYSHNGAGYQMWNRFRRARKTATEGAEATC